MPLRLIERFDQRWRDTPVKNQQPPVPPLSLCIPLFLYPSLSPSVALSIPSIYIPSSLICPTFPPPLLPLLRLVFLCKHIHTEGSEQPSCFPPCSSSFLLPRWLRSCAQRRQQHRPDGPQRSLTPIIAIRQPALISLQHMHMTCCNKLRHY